MFRWVEAVKKPLPIEALAVISEETMIPLCEKYGIRWVFYKNEPVGERKTMA